MKKQNSHFVYLQQRPVLVGFLAVAMVLVLGFGTAYATGLTSPSSAKADDTIDSGLFTTDTSPGDLSGGLFAGDTSLTDPTLTNTPITSDVPSTADITSVTSDPVVSTPASSDTSVSSNPTLTDTPPAVDSVDPSTPDSTNIAPCNCDNAPTLTDTPPVVDSPTPTVPDSTNVAPCDCGGTVVPPDITTPPDTTSPPVDTPPVIVTPPVVITPPIVQVCPTGDTGTYPDCVTPTPPPPPPAQVCPVGDTGTYPDCVGPTPPPVQVCPTGDTGTYPDCVTPTPPPAQICPTGDTGTYPDCVPPPVPPPGGGGCISGCGGVSVPSGIIETVFSGGGGGVSGQVFLPHAPVAQVASVYLSQIPYTGLDLGPVGTIVYWAALILFCLLVAYLLIFKLIPFIRLRLQNFGLHVNAILNQPSALAVAGVGVPGAHSEAASAHTAHGTHSSPSHASNYPELHPQTYTPSTAAVSHSVAMPTKQNPSAYSALKGFSSFAQGETLTIDDIVNGLARLPEVQSHSQTQAPVEEAAKPAYQSAEEIISSHQMQAPVMPERATSTYVPQTTRKEESARVISTDVRDFCAALLHGNRDTVFGTLRQIVREGGDAEMFLTQVVCALDDAYRNRLDGTSVHAEIAQLTQNCATTFLERLTGALTNAVDSSYSPGITGSKLALTRALAVVEG